LVVLQAALERLRGPLNNYCKVSVICSNCIQAACWTDTFWVLPLLLLLLPPLPLLLLPTLWFSC
jgi:hypothetical protein